jgi:hypothetical protein
MIGRHILASTSAVSAGLRPSVHGLRLSFAMVQAAQVDELNGAVAGSGSAEVI